MNVEVIGHRYNGALYAARDMSNGIGETFLSSCGKQGPVTLM